MSSRLEHFNHVRDCASVILPSPAMHAPSTACDISGHPSMPAATVGTALLSRPD